MKLAYVTARYPFGTGEDFLEAELRALMAAGVEPVLVPTNYRGLQPRELPADLASLPVFDWQSVTPPRLGAALLQAAGPVAGLVRDFSADRDHLMKNLLTVPGGVAVAAMIRQRGLTHVHAHWLSTSATMALVAARVAQVPLSISCHRWDIYDANLLNLKARQARFVRVISERAAGLVRERIDADLAGRVRVIHMGVEVEDVQPRQAQQPAGDAHVTMVANLVPVKGHEYLIESVRLLRERGVPVHLDLVGSGEREAELRALTARLGLEANVSFLGQLPRSEVLERYAQGAAQVVVLSSVDLGSGLHEGIPVALMEAMAAGVPVVSTSTGSIPELIENEVSGVLVAPQDAAALADALERLLTDPEFAATLADRAAQRVQSEFSATASAARLVEELR